MSDSVLYFIASVIFLGIGLTCITGKRCLNLTKSQDNWFLVGFICLSVYIRISSYI